RIVGVLHGTGPIAYAHVSVQWRQPVGGSAQHVQLVCQLVDHQVVAVPAAALLYAGPGEDHRALQPGLAAVLAVPLMLDTGWVAVFLWAKEVVGIQNDLVKAPVPAELIEAEQR